MQDQDLELEQEDQEDENLVDCPSCAGSGECQECEGDGCDYCGDTGECQDCDGTGQVEEELDLDEDDFEDDEELDD